MSKTPSNNDGVFRAHAGWYAYIAGKCHGPWTTRGAAEAVFLTMVNNVVRTQATEALRKRVEESPHEND